jgi:hypothetical protein
MEHPWWGAAKMLSKRKAAIMVVSLCDGAPRAPLGAEPTIVPKAALLPHCTAVLYTFNYALFRYVCLITPELSKED